MKALVPDRSTNPHLWPVRRKCTVVAICVWSTTMAAWSAGSYASAAGPLSAKFDCSNVAVLAGITMFTVGVAFFPMITAPVSEVYGRRWLFIGTYILFEITTIGCALVTNLAGMLLLRFFVGTGASSFSTMVGGLLADCFESSTRGFPLALFSTGTFIGTALGPLASDFIVPRWGYAWLFWMQAILNGAGLIAVAILLPETRMSVLLRREAQRRNALSTEQEEFGESDESQKPLAQLIRTSLLRPFHFLATESIVFWFSLWITFAWSILYLFFVSIPFVFTNEHGFSQEQVGLVYSAVIVASLVSLVLTVFQDQKFRHSTKPEARLYSCCALSLLLPTGLFMYAFTASLHYMLPVTAIFLITLGIYSIYLAVFNYLSDAYGVYASSALAAQSFLRNFVAGFFPLFGGAMFSNLGIARAGSILGGIALGLSFVPFVLVVYGNLIRSRSPWLVKRDASV